MRLCMIGTGYVGLVSGVCFSDLGNIVHCVDNNKKKINLLNQGKIPIHEPGLDEILKRNVKQKRLFFTSDLKLAVNKADIVFICVGTPTKKRSDSADLKYVFQVAKKLRKYIKNVIASAKVMAQTLVDRGFRIVTGGTDSHIVWLDLTPKGLTGDKAEKILEEVGLACNKNAIPYDPNPPKVTSGLRFGTAAATTRGFKETQFKQVGSWILRILDNVHSERSSKVVSKVKKEVIELCSEFPIY